MNHINFVKGFFIFLIVLGHDAQITSQIDGLFRFLYRFHVHAFLFLPFLLPIKSTNNQYIVDRAFRYLVPYAFFLVFSSVIFLLFTGGGVSDFFINLSLAAFISTAPFIKEASGFQLYWFLPALFSLTVLRFLAIKYKYLILFISMVVLLLPTSVLGEYYPFIPFSLIISMYIYPMGIFTSFLYKHKHNNLVVLASILGFLISSYFLYIENVGINIAVYKFGTILNPLEFIAVILCPITGFMTVLYLSQALSKSTCLFHNLVSRVGSYSLIIFLVHPLFLQAFYKALEKTFKYDPIIDANFTTRVIGLVLAILIPMILFKYIIVRMNFQLFIFPKGRFNFT
jgi:hypothetical protein